MKYTIALLFFISGLHAFSQANDSLALRLKQLRAEREKLNAHTLQLDSEAAKKSKIISVFEGQYNYGLVTLDSVAGKVIQLEKKIKLNSAEQQRLEKLRTRQEKMKNELIAMEVRLNELNSQQDKISAEIRQMNLRISHLDEELKSLEKYRKTP